MIAQKVKRLIGVRLQREVEIFVFNLPPMTGKLSLSCNWEIRKLLHDLASV